MSQPNDFQQWLLLQSPAIVVLFVVTVLLIRAVGSLGKSVTDNHDAVTALTEEVKRSNANADRLILFIGAAEFASVVMIVLFFFSLSQTATRAKRRLL